MKVYKATFDMNASGILQNAHKEWFELYEAKSILEAEKMAHKDLKKFQKQAVEGYIPLIMMYPSISLSNLEVVE